MKRQVTLLFDPDCPNVELARENLRQAHAAAGQPADWQEVNISAGRTPKDLQAFGSPSILVDGVDLAGVCPDTPGNRCRLYQQEDGRFLRAPSVEMIVQALKSPPQNPSARGKHASIGQALLSLPGVGAAALPVGLCPACLPAFLGFLSALGLGFLLQSQYLLPLTIALLGLAMFGLFFRARSRRGFAPPALGAFGSLIIIIAKFALNLQLLLYIGVALLIGASIWNAWPAKSAKKTACPSCVPTGQAAKLQGTQKKGRFNHDY